MNSLNPYESPLSEASPGEGVRPTSRKNRIAWLALPSLFGAVLGSLVLAPYVRGPGDPFGHSMGAVLGGFLGLALGIMARFLVRPAA